MVGGKGTSKQRPALIGLENRNYFLSDSLIVSQKMCLYPLTELSLRLATQFLNMLFNSIWGPFFIGDQRMLVKGQKKTRR